MKISRQEEKHLNYSEEAIIAGVIVDVGYKEPLSVRVSVSLSEQIFELCLGFLTICVPFGLILTSYLKIFV